MSLPGPLALPVALPVEPAVAAVRDPHDDRVPCGPPGPAHDHVGRLPPRRFERRAALAAVARSRGERPPNADLLADARERLAALDPPVPERRTLEACGDVAALRERVARLQGRLRERRDRGFDTGDLEADLREATRALSEAETERVAGEQSVERARERSRAAFDARERRLELEDRVANLEREARAALAERVRPAVRDALAALPGNATDLEDATDAGVAFAAARVAAFDAPVVLAGTGPFPDPAAAARWLDADALYPVRS